MYSTFLKKADAQLSGLSALRLAVFSLLMVVVVGTIDHLTGYELSFSIFYLLPVGFASWYIRGPFCFFICATSAVTWLGLDLASGHQYSNQAVPFWNTGVRFGFFVIVAVLLRQIRRSLTLQSFLAQTDGLTGLMNARTFRERCAYFLTLAARKNHSLVLGYIDLDGFKGINDKLGHSVGDQVLKAVATTLLKRLRSSDIGARLGGDEFSILLPETDLTGAKTFFTSLHANLMELATDNSWPVGFSIGVAVFHSFEQNVDEAIRHADALMYRVKSSGKNRILFEEYGRISPNS